MQLYGDPYDDYMASFGKPPPANATAEAILKALQTGKDILDTVYRGGGSIDFPPPAPAKAAMPTWVVPVAIAAAAMLLIGMKGK